MPLATVNGVRIHYERYGESGEPLVFVHGITGDTTDWRCQAPEFARDNRVLLADNRGHGQSEVVAGRAAYTVLHMADDLEALLDDVGFERCHLVGHSMGGLIAQEIALRSPERLLSLTLHDTACWGPGEGPPASLPYTPPELAAAAQARIAGMSQDTLAGAWAGLTTWAGSTTRAHTITSPTLVICGDRDMPRIIEGSRKLAELIPDAELVIIEGAGHSPQLERPEQFNAALRAFLEKHTS
jgi:pimeloyl-ACP methyl ester carboxylesterase